MTDYLLRAVLQPANQPKPGQVHPHWSAGETRRDWDRPGYDAPPATELQELQQELADEAAQHRVETWAAWVPSTAPAWVYDVTRLDEDFAERADDPESDLQALRCAVRYLDLRQLLHRPIAGFPEFVTFARAA